MQTSGTIPVIIDTDMGADDWMATLLLLSLPQVSLTAVTVTGTGLAELDPGTQIALNLLQLGGQPLVPVAKGATTPLAGNNVFPQAWRTNTDNVFGLQLPKNSNGPSSLSAVELLSKAIRGASQPPTLVALGPLTNVAAAFQADPQLPSLLGGLFIMGGAVNVQGNVNATYPSNPNTVAEWNIYIDPTATQIVLGSGAPITLVPLDATNQAPITLDYLNQFQAAAKTPQAQFVYQVLAAQKDTIEAGQYFFWDPLAAGTAINSQFVTFQQQALGVVTAQGNNQGQILQLGPSTSTRYANGADGKAFGDFFLTTLNAAASAR